jgi:hypothetical protein
MKKDLITNGKILQGDALLEVLENLSPLVNAKKLDVVFTLRGPLE